jgi:hypothetical protein
MLDNEEPVPRHDVVLPDLCPKCGGSGRVVLLTRSRRCSRFCGGAASDAATTAGASAPGLRVLLRDERGRPTIAEWPDGQVVSYSYYAEAAKGTSIKFSGARLLASSHQVQTELKEWQTMKNQVRAVTLFRHTFARSAAAAGASYC